MHKSKNAVLTIWGKIHQRKSRKFCPTVKSMSRKSVTQTSGTGGLGAILSDSGACPQVIISHFWDSPPITFSFSHHWKVMAQLFCCQVLALYKPHVVRIQNKKPDKNKKEKK